MLKSIHRVAVTMEKLPDQSESMNHQENEPAMKKAKIIFVECKFRNWNVVHSCFGIFDVIIIHFPGGGSLHFCKSIF